MGNPDLSPVTLRLLWDRLVSIVDEATVAHHRTAFSTVVQEGNDFACSIMDWRGGTVANAQVGLPSFVGTQAITLRHLLDTHSPDHMQPGDIFITNDPWIATGQSMDLTLLAPIFVRGRLVGFAGSVAHSPDLGGTPKWNLSNDSFEEALQIPLMHLQRAGHRDETLLRLLAANSRLPELTLGDVEAQLTALSACSDGVVQLIAEYELDSLDEVVDAIFDRSETAMRRAISAIPDGRYTGEIWSDGFSDPLHLSVEADPLLIKATVVIEGSDLTVDYSGSSSQCAGSFNSVATFTAAYTCYGLRLILVPLLPNNAGFYRPLHVIAPEGSVVNARRGSATLSRHVIGHQVVDAVYSALADVLPRAVFGQSGSAPSWDLLLMGEDASDRPYHRLMVINGGTGAAFNHDGFTAAFPANLSSTPVEILENVMPVLIECKELIADSAGMGRYRGGFGQRMVFRALKPMRFSLINARINHPALGLLGGESARPGRAVAAGRVLTPGTDGELNAGDSLLLETPGGGGLGLRIERPAALTIQDHEDGLVTAYRAGPVNAG